MSKKKSQRKLKKKHQHWTDMHVAYQNLWDTVKAVLKKEICNTKMHTLGKKKNL